MRFVLQIALAAALAGGAASANECGVSRLDPEVYKAVDGFEDFRDTLANDLASYVSPNGTSISMWCFVKHFSEVGEGQIFLGQELGTT